MTKSDKAYRGVEYGLSTTVDGEWKWAFYPKTAAGAAGRGSVLGTREAAEKACRAAIDAFLDAGKSR